MPSPPVEARRDLRREALAHHLGELLDVLGLRGELRERLQDRSQVADGDRLPDQVAQHAKQVAQGDAASAPRRRPASARCARAPRAGAAPPGGRAAGGRCVRSSSPRCVARIVAWSTTVYPRASASSWSRCAIHQRGHVEGRVGGSLAVEGGGHPARVDREQPARAAESPWPISLPRHQHAVARRLERRLSPTWTGGITSPSSRASSLTQRRHAVEQRAAAGGVHHARRARSRPRG